MVGFNGNRRLDAFVFRISQFDFIFLLPLGINVFRIFYVGILFYRQLCLDAKSKIAQFPFVSKICDKRVYREIAIFLVLIGKLVAYAHIDGFGDSISCANAHSSLLECFAGLLETGFRFKIK